MEDNPQEYLALTLENLDGDVLEFIKHQNLHYYVYYNGAKTDVRFPRHEQFNKNMKRIKIFKKLWYGNSKYNKRKIGAFFANLIPEHFL